MSFKDSSHKRYNTKKATHETIITRNHTMTVSSNRLTRKNARKANTNCKKQYTITLKKGTRKSKFMTPTKRARIKADFQTGCSL
jgi:hypothetical protein